MCHFLVNARLPRILLTYFHSDSSGNAAMALFPLNKQIQGATYWWKVRRQFVRSALILAAKEKNLMFPADKDNEAALPAPPSWWTRRPLCGSAAKARSISTTMALCIVCSLIMQGNRASSFLQNAFPIAVLLLPPSSALLPQSTTDFWSRSWDAFPRATCITWSLPHSCRPQEERPQGCFQWACRTEVGKICTWKSDLEGWKKKDENKLMVTAGRTCQNAYSKKGTFLPFFFSQLFLAAEQSKIPP